MPLQDTWPYRHEYTREPLGLDELTYALFLDISPGLLLTTESLKLELATCWVTLAFTAEMAKYDAATDVALKKGITDAFGSAGTNAMSTYLDMGAGALILWYGGTLAMDGEDRMTAGRLITYQL